MTELKPCPFCGGDNINATRDSYVSCDNCDVFGPSHNYPMSSIAAWNTRAKLSERDPIGAAIMRERAAAWMDDQALTEEELAQGYGFTVDYPRVAAEAIRAIPLPTHAETLAYALQMPEIEALVNMGTHIRQHLRGVTFSVASSTNPPLTSFISLKLPEQAIADFDAALAALEPKP